MFIELTPRMGKTKSLIDTTGLIIMEDSDGLSSVIVNGSLTRVQEKYSEIRKMLNYNNLVLAPVRLDDNS